MLPRGSRFLPGGTAGALGVSPRFTLQLSCEPRLGQCLKFLLRVVK